MTEPRKQRAEGAIETDSQRVPGSEDGGVIETDAADARYGLFNHAEEYKMNNKRRGMALIFNHERFHEFLALEDRRGTYADMNNLRQRLSEQGFEVSCHDNLKNEDVYKIIKEASIADHSDADCFLCVFLSHGERNHIYSYDAKNEIQTLINMFKGDKCLTLLGKPKIFIIQACRGNKCDDPVIKRDASIEPQNKIQAEDAPGTTLPAGADFLMCYSAAEGFVSFRDETYGSWYIQDLCNTMKQCGSSLEMLELLTLVNRKVSARQVTDIRGRGKKQMPCFSSMLTKKLYLHPK